jgi:hypothetical protein
MVYDGGSARCIRLAAWRTLLPTRQGFGAAGRCNGHVGHTFMCITDTILLARGLERLREVNDLLDDSDAGVCLIHLEACIAALESRLAALNAAGSASDLTATAHAAPEFAQSFPDVSQ